ncbi:hypothetical protein ACF08M_15880 [Streptomyces sp. NPDC015032]|uniref:hypothetical protein n=1 Tax=Streptomyces sp. NPDC015032 TaxID=3364937 RepID=UPI0036FE5B21
MACRHLQPPPPAPAPGVRRTARLREQRAAEAKGNKGGRRPAIPADKTDAVRTAYPSPHRQFLARCQPLDGIQGVPAIPAQRKARREYENRVNALGGG